MKEIKNNKIESIEDVAYKLINELEKREEFGWCAVNLCGANRS